VHVAHVADLIVHERLILKYSLNKQCQGVDWIYLAQDGNQWQDLLNRTSHKFGFVSYSHAMLLDKGFPNHGLQPRVSPQGLFDR
jgi:hypothetical protein